MSSPSLLILDVLRVRCPKSRRGERTGYAMMNRPYCLRPFLERGLILLVHCYFVKYILAFFLFVDEKISVNLTAKYPCLTDSNIFDKIKTQIIFGINLFSFYFFKFLYFICTIAFLKANLY